MSLTDLLSHPVDWASWTISGETKQFLDELQANILKGHGRDHTRNLFLSFGTADMMAVRPVLQAIGHAVTSARTQLLDTQAFKATGVGGGTVVCFFLSRTGYDKLGFSAGRPADAAFTAGMAASRAKLADPAKTNWETAFDAELDAMLLLADDDETVLGAEEALWTGLLTGAGVTVAVEPGRAIKRIVNGKPEGIEHFGYVDGRSQPLFLTADLENEPSAHWDPAFPPRQFLLQDPLGKTPLSAGSYFVFRKLEQNVKGFKDSEAELENALGLAGTAFQDRAGALVVGRFEDGTPVVTSPLASDVSPINDFNFDEDPQALRCPFRAHIRKTNPRGESPAHLAALSPPPPASALTVTAERGHIMARRGITFGPHEPAEEDAKPEDQQAWPASGNGLLFMAYMADIANQFEFTQATWANNQNFVVPDNGVDPVIAQTENDPAKPAQTTWKDGWSTLSPTPTASLDFSGFVAMKGGEYFFAPSIGFLRTL